MAVTQLDVRKPVVRPGRERPAVSAPARRLISELLVEPAAAQVTGPAPGIPPAARRWLHRVVVPGAVAPSRARLWMHGEIRLGDRWHGFEAEQLLVPHTGFVWAARCRWGPVALSGYDAFAGGRGRMRWAALGLPVLSRGDGDVTRSAADRLAAESILVPLSLLGEHWRPAADPDSAEYLYRVESRHARPRVTIHVAGDGRLIGVRMARWGAPSGGGYGLHQFAVDFAGEFNAGSMLIPDGIRASWPDAGGEFFRATLDRVELA